MSEDPRTAGANEPAKIVHQNLRLNRAPDRSRFELWKDSPNADSEFIGFVGYIKEEDHDGVPIYELQHTIIAEQHGRQGFARALVTMVMDFLKSHSAKFISHCSYIDSYLERYPEYEELRAPRHSTESH